MRNIDAFQEYVECSTHAVRRQCGDEAADFSRGFLDKMSSSMIQLHCTEYGRRECGLISSATSLFNTQQPVLVGLILSIVSLIFR
ncbi:unnamed protein product [Callosobruchus maculatus]|uniref:Uncharacterized protein n=1 Tax=Callosobruchus maculatus TaxID=64391 RepID=A0A653D5C1_CALMS|nr:unnamed protein product [Callosobruchus maculatus]